MKKRSCFTIKNDNYISKEQRDELKIYFGEVGSHPLLSAEEEVELFRRYREENSREAREKIINSNLRLVLTIAKQHSRSTIGLNDLIEEGNIGLITAVEKFDPTIGVRFGSYACWYIKENILKFIKTDGTIQKGVYISDTQSKIKEVNDKYQQLYQRDAEIDELKEELQKGEYSTIVEDVMGAPDFTINLDDVSTHDGSKDGERVETFLLADSERQIPKEESFFQDNVDSGNPVEKLKNHIKTKFNYSIDKRDWNIFFDYMDLVLAYHGECPEVLRELSERYGIGEERIRQIVSGCKIRVKNSFKASDYFKDL